MGKPLTYERIRKIWFRAMNRADVLRTRHAAAARTVENLGPALLTPEQKKAEKLLRSLAARHLEWSMRAWTLQRALRPPPPEKFKRGKRKVA